MLTILLSLLSSNAVGSLVGWIGGWLNRKVDLQNRDKDLEVLKEKNAHELLMRDKDMEQSKIEAEAKVEVAIKESEGLIESEAYKAMAASYSEQSTTSGITWIDGFSKAIRPSVTVIFTLASLIISATIIHLAIKSNVQFTVAEWKEWVTYVIHWVFFQAGVVIGWWFANRPGSKK